MITTPHTRPFKYPVLKEYAELELDPTKIEFLALFDPAGNLYDASGNERHGDMSNSSGFSPVGRYGFGTKLDGENDIIPLANSAGLHFVSGGVDQPFSLSTYINVDATAAGLDYIITKWNTDAREWRLTVTEVAGVYGVSLTLIDEDNAAFPNVVAGSDPLSPGICYHVVATYDPSVGSGDTAADGMELYINGKIVGVTRNNADPGAYVAMEELGASITLGSRTGALNPFDGILDNALIYSGALDASQVLNMFNKGL